MDTHDTRLASIRLFDYDVLDSSDNKVGTVDGVWADDATNRPEFIAVRTGSLFGRNHIVPIEQAQIDDASRTLHVPYSADQIKDAPSFSNDDEFSPADEQRIYNHYGLERSTASSPTGYAAGTTGPGETETGQTGQSFTGESEVRIPVHEEELQVGKRQVQAGQVHVHKVVRSEHQDVPVELRREDVEIERVPAAGDEVSDKAFQAQEINVPVNREEPVVGKETHVAGQVRVAKNVDTETQTVRGEVRKEEVEVDDEGDANVEGSPRSGTF